MRKWMLALMAAALVIPTSYAAAKDKIEYGIEAGYGFSTLGGDRIDINGTQLLEDGAVVETIKDVPMTGIFKSKSAFFGGIYAQVSLTDKFFFRPGLAYVEKGSKPSINGADVWTQYTDGEMPSKITENVDAKDLSGSLVLTTHYIEVPLLVGMNLKPADSKIVPSVFLGPTVGYLVNSELTAANLVAFDAHNFVSKFDFGAAVGAGVKMDRVSVNVRYEYGLTNVFSKSGKTETINPEMIGGNNLAAKLPDLSFKNRSLLVSVAYALN